MCGYLKKTLLTNPNLKNTPLIHSSIGLLFEAVSLSSQVLVYNLVIDSVIGVGVEFRS